MIASPFTPDRRTSAGLTLLFEFPGIVTLPEHVRREPSVEGFLDAAGLFVAFGPRKEYS
jgi:hypothetical protein